jgi:ribosomal protein S18 acetylase RimI-like enzyme
MEIRKAKPIDIDALMDLRAGFNDYHKSLAGKKPGKGWQKIYRQELIRELRSKKILKLIAFDGGKPVGTAFCGILENQPGTNAWLESRKTGLIRFIYVRDRFRGRGIATKLVKECLSWTKKQGAGIAELMVAGNNAGAHKLYKRLGFEDVSVRMTKKL